jgi:toxin-antitoxin system PIN domain toxin
LIAIDTNLLVYAHRRESRFHLQAASLIKSLAEGREAWAVPWPCIYEFFSVVTHPKIWKAAASSPDEAARQVRGWTASPTMRLLQEPPDFMETLDAYLQLPRVRGPIVHDARIAALCAAHGVTELLTRDRDFQLFAGLRTRDPFG